MSDTAPNPGAHPEPSSDALGKQRALDAEMAWAKVELLLETLETRGRDVLDFPEIPVWSLREVVRHAFEGGYRDGLHTGYRQGRSDACDEMMGKQPPTQPRNPTLKANPTT